MNWLPRKVVLVPIDFSEDSFAAVETASELAGGPAAVHAVHVLPELEPTEPGVIWHTVDDASRRDHATKALRAELAKRGCEGLQVEIRFGDPGHEIAELAAEIHASLIVIPSHGKKAFKRILLGSVADRVVRLAHCPVLVLKR